jgi:hypothetical protein
MKTLALGPILLILLLGGCRDEVAREASEAVRTEREIAYRQACAANVIARDAEENLEILEATFAITGQSSDGAISQQTTSALVAYSRAYQQHAELRASAYAYLDSAVNHSSSTADSARYMTRAASFSIRTPTAGTVEANVMTAYANSLYSLLSDNNHRCNWDFPF